MFSGNRILLLVTRGLQRSRAVAGILICIGVLSGIASGAIQEDHSVPAVIFDTDVDFDDTVALAVLAQQHLRGTMTCGR